ncbi:MAG TPA: NUDIX domain-containing protein [Acholeplasmataceae bacterium]|nr:NUDIX domain-containing protein [Acholeplasmataceae bacterium]
MKGYNVIIILNKALDKILLCERKKNPYSGMKNFVGGKIEKGESSIDAAYRELQEETSITKNDVKLIHLMDFTYHLDNIYVEVWVGQLNKDLEVKGDENYLFWSSLDHNFFDLDTYAGEGNMGHMLEHVKMKKDELFKKES